MEAKCLHEFRATSKEELSFDKNGTIKILDKDSDANWYKAELGGKEGFVPSNYIQLAPHEWYHGKVSRQQAEQMLMQTSKDGAFLIRDCESSPGAGGFSLSVRAGGSANANVQHFKVLRDDTGKYFLWVVKFNSLNELIAHHKTNTVSRSEDIFLVVPYPKGGFPAAAAAPAAPPPRPTPAAAPAPAQKQVQAQYPFEPQESGELRFKKGDIITVIDSSDANWWKGTCRGETGLFPSSYVKAL